MPRRAKQKKSVEAYSHEEAKRKNNPHVGLVSSATDKLNGRTIYAHDPHIDPYLTWAGKKEGTDFEIQNVSLHIHERIDPKRIVHHFLKQKEKSVQQLSLFQQPENEPPLNKAIDFYKHEQDWSNRLIAGDSLLVMNSLLNKEGMAGKVQMIYFDPPYGIKYNSNFQPFTNKRSVSEKDEDIPAEPEMIQAFRDTWQLGLHSYLTHMRTRLIMSKELLKPSGSCFVQISDENLHHMREIMDEIFGAENFVALIPFRKKTMPLGAKYLEQMNDFILWYGKNKEELKYRPLFVKKNYEGDFHWQWCELKDGSRRKMTKEEIRDRTKLPDGARVYRLVSMWPPSYSAESVFAIEFKGRSWTPPAGQCWPTNREGMQRLIKLNLIEIEGNYLRRVVFEDESSFAKLTASWEDTIGTRDKRYVVQTSEKVVERCMHLSTDPGDLVLDPTCGSGTTAYVAEKWGRRWITCDTSRVAVALARQRFMTAQFDYYALLNLNEGIASGFQYETITQVTLKSLLGENAGKKENTLYDKPRLEREKIRVTGPFTVEAVPSLRVKPFDGEFPKIEGAGDEIARSGETSTQSLWRDELKAAGIRAVGGKKIDFARIEPMKATRFLHAEGEIIDGDLTKKALISFGPDYGPLEQRQAEEAIKEARSLKARPDIVVFAAFHFDPEAAKDIDQIKWDGVQILKAQMSVDLLTVDLRKKRSSNQSYWLIGQPDVEVMKDKKGTFRVKVNGFDYYDPISSEIESKSIKQIAMWFLDTDYDERSLFPAQVFFPQGDKKRDWTKLAKSLNSDVDEEALEAFTGTESLPFKAGEHKKVAIKIIDNRGIESFVIKKLA
jgi:adenine-specific DNA-methyltransferase